MFKRARIKKSVLAQTATELAIFGAILLFVLGLLIKYAVNFNFNQQLPMEAFRRALQLSHQVAGGSADRRFSSVVVIDDKDLPDVSNALAVSSRTGFAAQGSATFNDLLFTDISYNNRQDLPAMDMYINGKRYSFTTAGFKEYGVPESGFVRTAITENDEKFDRSQTGRFEPGLPTSAYWQWLPIEADTATIVTEDKKNISVDADTDGKEEVVLKIVESAVCAHPLSENEQERQGWVESCAGNCCMMDCHNYCQGESPEPCCNWPGGCCPPQEFCCSMGCCNDPYCCSYGGCEHGETCNDPACCQSGNCCPQQAYCCPNCNCESGPSDPTCCPMGNQGLCEQDCKNGFGCSPSCRQICEAQSYAECKANKIGALQVIDYQEGDIDLTTNSKDIAEGRATQGLRFNTVTEQKVEPGTSLQIKEDDTKIINIATVKRKDSIERVIQLNCHSPDPIYCTDTSGPNGTCCCSDGVRYQANSHAGDGDNCDPATGELHVFSKPAFQKKTTWTTPH